MTSLIFKELKIPELELYPEECEFSFHSLLLFHAWCNRMATDCSVIHLISPVSIQYLLNAIFVLLIVGLLSVILWTLNLVIVMFSYVLTGMMVNFYCSGRAMERLICPGGRRRLQFNWPTHDRNSGLWQWRICGCSTGFHLPFSLLSHYSFFFFQKIKAVCPIVLSDSIVHLIICSILTWPVFYFIV